MQEILLAGKSGIERIIEGLQDLVFPESLYCICCGNIIDKSRSYSLCDHCMTHIHWNLEDVRVIKASEDDDFDGIDMIKCVDYGIYERSIIFALKYDNHKYIARIIGKIMRDRLDSGRLMRLFSGCEDDWTIVPVPLHPKRMRERGYNHAELIAKYLGKEIGVRVEDILVRIRDTAPMKGLGPEKREKNILKSIKAMPYDESLLHRNILLIDDFYTTGSTAKECLRAFRESGFSGKIMMLAFAAR